MKASIVYLMAILLAATCAKSSSSGKSSSDIIGNWKLVETLADPGDGSGKWRPVSSNNTNSYVEFTGNGNVISSTLFAGFDRYEFDTDSARLILKKSSGAETQELRYQLNNRQLTLNLPCIEPCGLRFTKIK